MEYIIKTSSPEESQSLGEKIGSSLNGTEIIALYGGLGMGKTTFTRGLAKGLEVDYRDISSPTFALVHEHEGRSMLYHFDMYRVETMEDLYSTGFFDYLGTGIIVIEWSENIEFALPEDIIRIDISRSDSEEGRVFRINTDKDIGVSEYENTCN